MVEEAKKKIDIHDSIWGAWVTKSGETNATMKYLVTQYPEIHAAWVQFKTGFELGMSYAQYIQTKDQSVAE